MVSIRCVCSEQALASSYTECNIGEKESMCYVPIKMVGKQRLPSPMCTNVTIHWLMDDGD